MTSPDGPRRWTTLSKAVPIALLTAGSLMVLGSAMSLQGGENATAPAPPLTSEVVDNRAAGVQILLRRQQEAIRAEDVASFAETWSATAAAQRRAHAVYSNLRRLGVDWMSLRYLGSAATGVPLENRHSSRSMAWMAEVEVTWRAFRLSRRPATSTVSYTFVDTGGVLRVSDIAVSSAGRAPLWMFGRLWTARTPRTLAVAATSAAATRLDAELARSRRTVQRVLPRWRGTLVAWLPGSSQHFRETVDIGSGDSTETAAVSATLDGSRDSEAPVGILLNPGVYRDLSAVGRRVVLTHEATHVAAGAVSADVPLWLAEGFADYVGVGAVDAPVSVWARLALREVRSEGAPETLPTDADFDGRLRERETSYELAALAAGLIAAEYGERRLAALHHRVVMRPGHVARAFRVELGVTEGAFTRQWRRHLEQLADGR